MVGIVAVWRYLRFLCRHKYFVWRASRKLGIPWLGVVHDLSKFRPDEFVPYLEFFYGAPHPERVAGDARGYVRTKGDVRAAFDRAWLLHIHRNRHHWQSWLLAEDEGGVKALEMPDRYRREMVSDWVGAGLAITGRDNLGEWYAKHRDTMRLGPETRRWVEAFVRGRAREGS